MRLVREEIVVPAVGAVIILAASAMLYGEFTEKGSGSAGTVVGKLTYRYRVAQRKSAANVLWEDADPGDPVYGNDSVRTDDQSEAIVDLDGSAVIELDPQSMIVVNVERGTPSISLEQGGIAVVPGANKNVGVKTKEGMIRSDGRVRLWRNEQGLQLDSERSVSVDNGREKKDVPRGAYTLNEKGIQPATKAIELISPRDNARTFIPDAEASVKMEWKSAGPVTVEVASDRDFQRIIVTRPSSLGAINQTLSEGIYYWRVREGAALSDMRKFRLVRNPPVSLLSPGPEARSGKAVSFFWKEIRLANAYRIEIARDDGFQNAHATKVLYRTSVMMELEPGTYYWRITSIGPFADAVSRSEIRKFEVSDGDTVSSAKEPPGVPTKPAENGVAASAPKSDELRPPGILFPATGSIIDMSHRDSIPFQWTSVPGARAYNVSIMNAGTGALVLRQEVRGTSLNFSDLGKLDTGRFVWSVEVVVDGPPKGGLYKTEAAFTITLTEKIEKPELNIQ